MYFRRDFFSPVTLIFLFLCVMQYARFCPAAIDGVGPKVAGFSEASTRRPTINTVCPVFVAFCECFDVDYVTGVAWSLLVNMVYVQQYLKKC